MALVNRLPALSPSHLSTSSRKLSAIKAHPSCSLSYNPSSSSSPFTEKHSLERYQRDSWLYKDASLHASCSLPSDSNYVKENDIALQLPELKKLLQVLKEKRETKGFNGENRGIGNVFLVGTGPGDPELLTLKALRVIESADLLLYDRLVSNDVLNLVRADARLLYVGKTAGYHSRTQVRYTFLFPLFFFFSFCLSSIFCD